MAELEADEQETRTLAKKANRAKFLTELLNCGDVTASAAVIGVHRMTVYREMELDGRFRRNVEITIEAWHRRQLKELDKAKDWRARAWRLSKRFADKYGDKADVSRGENVGTMITPDADVTAMDETVPKEPPKTKKK